MAEMKGVTVQLLADKNKSILSGCPYHVMLSNCLLLSFTSINLFQRFLDSAARGIS